MTSKVLSACRHVVKTLIARRIHVSTAAFREFSPQPDEDPDDSEYQELQRQYLQLDGTEHHVLVVQPYIKWGPKKRYHTTPDLMLQESVSLIRTLSGWSVLDQVTIGLTHIGKKQVFGTGNLNRLRERVKKDHRITAIFVSIDMLTGLQYRELSDLFHVRIYDRYTIVLHIFTQHAQSQEAKMQVALAEIPYLRSRLRDAEGEVDRASGAASYTSGSGETYLEVQKRLLAVREKKLVTAIKSLRARRTLLRRRRQKMDFPVVAVVGYTNAGKTSLIKALTGSETLEPKDYLFATLDVTVHKGLLASALEVLYVDTVGFISDIPTALVEAFVTTLEDAMLADLIIHVRDISHPDTVSQAENVDKTLESLLQDRKVLENTIVVGNKIDLLDGEPPGDLMTVSCEKGTGLAELKNCIETELLSLTNRIKMIFRVKTGGSEFSWLYKEAAVEDTAPDPSDSQFTFVKVIISQSNLAKFKHRFGGVDYQG